MNTNKGFAPIVAIIIAVIIIAGGIGGYLYIKNKNTLPIVTPSNTLNTTVVTTTSTVVTTTSTDVTANWKTYINTMYGFEIKYPNTWFIKECGTYFIGFSYAEAKLPSCDGPVKPSPHIGIDVVLAGQTINDDIQAVESDINNPVKTEVMLGGNLVTKITGKTKKNPMVPEGLKTTVIVIYHGGAAYQIRYIEQDNKDYSAIFNQMLSTFKFTK